MRIDSPRSFDAVKVVVATLVILGSFVFAWKLRSDMRERITALRLCVVGEGSFEIDDTVVLVRRIQPSPLEKGCVELAREVSQDRLVAFYEPEIVRVAADLTDRNEMPTLIALVGATERYAKGTPSRGTERWPLLDREVDEHRAALDGFVPSDIGYRALDVALPSRNATLRVEAGETGRPFTQVKRSASIARPRVLSEEGRLVVDPGKRSLGPGQLMFTFDPWVFFRRPQTPTPEGATEPGPSEIIAAKLDGSVEFTFDIGEVQRHTVCRNTTREAVALVGQTEAHVLFVEGDSVTRVGAIKLSTIADTASRIVTLSCVGDEAILVEAISLPPPGSWSSPDIAGRYRPLPTEPQHHRLSRATCTSRGCASEVLEIEDLDCTYFSLGGWSSSLALGAPSAVDLGTRTLVYWSSGDNIRFRFAPWNELDTAETRTLVEVTHMENILPSRSIGYASVTHVSRGAVALLFVEENGPAQSVFPVRFDASGEVTPLYPE